MEQWKTIVGCSNYQISNRGRLQNILTGRIMKLSSCGKGYLKVGIVGDTGSKVQIMVHRLVAEYFIPNPKNKPEVNHKDGNRSNNWDENLEWVTHQENVGHSYSTGLKNYENTPRGTTQGASKLNDIEVMHIRKRVAAGESQNSLAREYHLTQGAINQIVQGITWSHLPIYEYTPHEKGLPKRAVNQYDMQGNFTQQFESMYAAAQATKIYRGSIGRVCQGKEKTAGGFIWRYAQGNTLSIEYSFHAKYGRPKKNVSP